MLAYHAAYYEMEDGWFLAKVLDFPGAVSQGRTLKSARIMIRDSLKGLADFILEKGETLPLPNPLADDKAAVFTESIRLKIRSHTGSFHEKEKTPKTSGKPRVRLRARRR
jgi:predicted RNase H-like HicB family nuclease